jgi:hypothetical protein
MKYRLTFFCCCLCISICYGQLDINRTKPIKPNFTSVTEFIKTNNFEYALVAWYTSIWPRTEEEFYCLVKQNGNWYLTKLRSPKNQNIPGILNVVTNERWLKPFKADSLLNEIKPDSAFRYTQEQFNNLPLEYTYTKDGLTYEVGNYISDAATYYLLQYANHTISTLHYYAPTTRVENFFPYVPQYSMLNGFIHATNTLAVSVEKR